MKILIVEDEAKIADYLKKGFSESGYSVEVAVDGREGEYLINEGQFDLIILDIMLPGLNGWQLLEIIRRTSSTPVIFLTARDAVEDKVRGLEQGADDYLAKPFSFAELLARSRKLLQRAPLREITLYQLADLQLEPLSRRVTRAGQRIELTNKEFTLLQLLISHEGEVMTRTYIASQVWHMNFDSDTNVVDVAIRRLRAKIDDGFETKLVHTVRGMGYVCEVRS